jgi:two-component system response regulator CssR
MKKIYLVEDEKALSQLLSAYLTDSGYTVVIFDDGLKAKLKINEAPDLWILDIMLPGMDGYALIKEIKKATPNIPVIFISARNAELDRVIGLEMGSDDYLPKPFLPRELVLRVNHILSHTKQPSAENGRYNLGPYVFDRSKRIISINDEILTFSVKEYDLLEFLIKHLNQAVSRNDMIDSVWGIDYFGSDRVVDDTLRRLRKKMPELSIEPVYGYGYILKGESV